MVGAFEYNDSTFNCSDMLLWEDDFSNTKCGFCHDRVYTLCSF